MIFHRSTAQTFRSEIGSTCRNTMTSSGSKLTTKVITVAPKRHQPFRTLDVGGQPNLKRFIQAVGSLVGDRLAHANAAMISVIPAL